MDRSTAFAFWWRTLAGNRNAAARAALLTLHEYADPETSTVPLSTLIQQTTTAQFVTLAEG